LIYLNTNNNTWLFGGGELIFELFTLEIRDRSELAIFFFTAGSKAKQK